MKHISKVLIILLFAAFAIIGSAQEMPSAKEMILGKRIFMALSDAARKELKLTQEQVRKIQDAFDGALQVDGDKIMITLSGPADFGEMAKSAMKVLDEAQTKRLEEIFIQSNGAITILDDKIAKTLEITTEQKRKAEQLADDAAKDMMEMSSDGGDHEVRMKDFAAKREKLIKKFDSLLTESQRKKLEEMKGKPFKPNDKKNLS